ncbi:MAG: type II toxin-antitoxin system RelE/ParE family toxin [Magnetococcales bacterium]|nr:type II toxin-antitoxin system RelE/ParE family toxin [Magnetococcales bacterium]
MHTPPILDVVFFLTSSDNNPVRDWLRSLPMEDRKIVGEDLKTVQFRWPLGMPLVRKLEPGLWEVRTHLSSGRIARVLFTVQGRDMVLLHGFEKKSRKTPKEDLDLARNRMRQYKEANDEQA